MSTLKRTTPLTAKTPLMRGTGLKRRAPLAEVGRRAQAKGRKSRKNTGPSRTTRELVLERDEYRCVVCGESVFERQASVHHRRNRGSGGSSDPAINRPSNLLTVCGTGTTGDHGWIGQRPVEAMDLGYVVSLNSTDEPADVPVHHAVHGLVYLNDDGGVTPVGFEAGAA